MGLFKSIAAFFKPEDGPSMPELGRNDVCWCGSGLKYKRCHLEKDEEKYRAALKSNCGTS
jgi:hypothetical protein